MSNRDHDLVMFQMQHALVVIFIMVPLAFIIAGSFWFGVAVLESIKTMPGGLNEMAASRHHEIDPVTKFWVERGIAASLVLFTLGSLLLGTFNHRRERRLDAEDMKVSK